MYYLLICMGYILSILSCNEKATINQIKVNVDTVFVNWNKCTLHSLTEQINNSNDSAENNLYENRILSFKALVGIVNEEDVNVNSIRYQFFKQVDKSSKVKTDFYVIEANRLGERVEILNYILYPNINNTRISVYSFKGGTWIQKDTVLNFHVSINNDLKTYKTMFGLGFNQDDIIITHFSNSKPIASQYYLFSTLSNEAKIKEILDQLKLR